MLRSNDLSVKEIQTALDKYEFDSYEEAMGYLMALENEIEKLKKKIEKLENKT
jgi:DNA-binding transcriptional MerR regulator